MMKQSVIIQRVTVFALIAVMVMSAILSLGFMSNFFNLFMDGDDGMFDFFKSVQELNSSFFSWSILFLVLSLMYTPFDLHKKAAGIFGLCYSVLAALLNIYQTTRLLSLTERFRDSYAALDFNSLPDYRVSYVPFTLATVLLIAALVLSVLLPMAGGISFLGSKKRENIEGGSHEA